MYRIARNVPMEAIRYDDAPCYRQEGFGGSPPWDWPVVGFFETYLRGREGEAEADFAQWYWVQFSKYWHVPKRRGGFRGGSLFRRVVREHLRRTGRQPQGMWEVPENVIRTAIEELIARRWALLESLRRRGYRYEGATPPEGTMGGATGGSGLHLWEGHHRTAALYALGHPSVPEIVLYPRWLRELPPVKRALRRRAGTSLSRGRAAEAGGASSPAVHGPESGRRPRP